MSRAVLEGGSWLKGRLRQFGHDAQSSHSRFLSRRVAE